MGPKDVWDESISQETTVRFRRILDDGLVQILAWIIFLGCRMPGSSNTSCKGVFYFKNI